MKLKILFCIFFILSTISPAQTSKSTLSVTAVVVKPEVKDTLVVKKADSLLLTKKDTSALGVLRTDSIAQNKTDSLHPMTEAAVARPDNAGTKIKLVKHNYDSRQQIIMAVFMMLFIGICMTSVQSWNPN